MDGTLALKLHKILERLAALEEGGSYVLPVASSETLGGIKVGENLTIEDGVLSGPSPYTQVNYSTTEQKTEQKWIDGKTIYQKTLSNIILATTGTWYNTDITDIDNVVFCDFSATHGGVQSSPDVNYAYVQWQVSGGVLQFKSYNASNGIAVKFATVRYTKTEVITESRSKNKK